MVERWCRDLAASEFPFPVMIKQGMAEVAAVRFLDEGGEICVYVANENGSNLVRNDEALKMWVRSPVPIPLEVMKLVVGKNLDQGAPHVGRNSVGSDSTPPVGGDPGTAGLIREVA